MAWKDIFKKQISEIKTETETEISTEQKNKIIEEFLQSDEFKQTLNQEIESLGKDWFKLYQKKNAKVEIQPEPTETTEENNEQELLEQFNIEGMNQTPEVIKLKNKN